MLRVLIAGMLTANAFLCIEPRKVSAGTAIQWSPASGGNGHYYEIVMPSTPADSWTWLQARDAAANMTYMGSVGHLVTVTSSGENAFLDQQFAGYIDDITPNTQTGRSYAWIGLYAPTETLPFQWVTGEAVTFTDWAPFEPNFFGTPYWQYVHYWNRDFGSGPTWTWNNEKNDGYNPPYNSYGFIVEFDGPFTAPVPEPSTLTMTLGFAAVCLAVTRWRRKKTAG